MGIKLCDSSDSDSDDISKIEINQEFARRYEHNKKREDLQRLQELKKKGIVDDSVESDGEESSDEDSEDDGIEDLEYFDNLLKVRNKDPILQNIETKLFESEDGEKLVKKGKKKDKETYLKDVMAKHLIEEGPEFDDGEEDFKGVKSYSEEQEELKRPFLEEVETDTNDGDEFFKAKGSGDTGIEDEEDENAGEVSKKLDEFFGEDEKLGENEMFLKKYFRNKMWLDRGDSGGKGMDDDDDIGVSEDEEEVEKQEDYEREFNFRFEENPGDRVMGHSRVVEGSVRKKTNTRKLQRERKEERIAQAEYERKEELKYLKNLKKREMNEKLKKIRDTAGIGDGRDCPLDLDDLEEEFDPKEHDKKMRVAFDDDYYGADDADPEFGSDNDEEGGEHEKPDFDKEDELLGLAKGWDDMDNSGDGFKPVRERILKQKVDKEVVTANEGKQKKKYSMSALEEEVIKRELDEYYKLDYEDTIGDLKTRFKYRPVNAKRYGLNTNAVLLLDDKELNQHVPLKKIAPYREKEWKVPRVKVYNQKLKINSLLQGKTSDGQNSRKRKFRDDEGTSRDDKKLHNEESISDLNNLSKSSTRRHRKAALKLSQGRLMAYGKIPSKSKSKKN